MNSILEEDIASGIFEVIGDFEMNFDRLQGSVICFNCVKGFIRVSVRFSISENFGLDTFHVKERLKDLLPRIAYGFIIRVNGTVWSSDTLIVGSRDDQENELTPYYPFSGFDNI